jgi:hypothetical protein
MGLDRVLGDHESLGDLGVLCAGRDHLEHLELPAAEHVLPGRNLRPHGEEANERVLERLRVFARQPRLATGRDRSREDGCSGDVFERPQRGLLARVQDRDHREAADACRQAGGPTHVPGDEPDRKDEKKEKGVAGIGKLQQDRAEREKHDGGGIREADVVGCETSPYASRCPLAADQRRPRSFADWTETEERYNCHWTANGEPDCRATRDNDISPSLRRPRAGRAPSRQTGGPRSVSASRHNRVTGYEARRREEAESQLPMADTLTPFPDEMQDRRGKNFLISLKCSCLHEVAWCAA